MRNGTMLTILVYFQHCQKVYGVEIVEKAAEDARQNAKENGFENVAVFTGKAEENMPFLMQHCTKSNTVGVVDPPRAGLSKLWSLVVEKIYK